MSFISIIQSCLSPIDDVRNQGEHYLNKTVEENYAKCLNDILDILINEDSDIKLRKLCATMIKNLINQSKYQGKWEELPKNFRDNIKNNILACLASTNKELCTLIAVVISSICQREIPSGNWNEIIPILCQTSQNPNPSYRLSSIITIGYITQDLQVGDLSQDQINHLLTALIQNLTPGNDQLFMNDIISFMNILPYVKVNMDNIEERKIILDKLITLTSDMTVPSEIKELLIQSLTEVVRMYYPAILDRMGEITTLTCYYIKFHLQHKRIAVLSIELWCSFCEEENMRIKADGVCGFKVKAYQQELFNAIQEVLINRDGQYEMQNKDEWIPFKGVVALIENMSQCTGDSFINNALAFIGKYLNDNNILLKDSAYQVFGGILASPLMTNDVIIASIPKLLEQLAIESNYIILRSISWCFSQLSEHHYSLFDNQLLFDSTMVQLLKILEIQSNHNEIICYLLFAFNRIIIGLTYKYYFDPHLLDYLTFLMQLAYRKGAFDIQSNVTYASFGCMGKIIENTSNDSSKEIFTQFFSKIYQLLSDSLNPANFTSLTEQETIQACLAMIISDCCTSNKIQMNQEQVVSVYNLLKQTFINRNCVYEEGLMGCSALAFVAPKDFLVILNDFVSFFLHGLKSKTETSLCSMTVSCISNLIHGLEYDFGVYLPQIMPYIFDILQDEVCDKFLKIKCLLILSDIFSNSPTADSFSFYPKSMELIVNAMSAATILPKEDDDPDLLNYFSLLKQRIIEVLTCIIDFLKDHSKKDNFRPFIPQVMEFLNIINQKAYLPSNTDYETSLLLIGDLCANFPREIRPYMQKDLLLFMFERVKQVNNDLTKEIVDYANVVSTPNILLIFL